MSKFFCKTKFFFSWAVQLNWEDLELLFIFIVSQWWKFSWASLQCFRKVRVSKKFMHNTGVTNFRRKFFSHSAEKFRGHPSNVSEKFGYRKVLSIKGVSYFSAEKCMSHSAKNFCQESFCLWENLWFRKVFTDGKGGAYLIVPSKKVGLTVQKRTWATLHCFRKFGVIEKFYAY